MKPRTRKYIKIYGSLSFPRNLSRKYGKKLKYIDKGLDSAKTASKKVFQGTTEAAELIGNKITEK